MISFSKLGEYGRLGNQLFQIAFTTHFANKHQIPYQLPVWEYAEYFDYEFNYTEKISKPFDLILQEPSLRYNEEHFEKYLTQMRSGHIDLEGFFQSYKYFTKDHVLNIFKPNNKFIPVKIDKEKSVAISVRRGDFVNHRNYNNIEAVTFIELLKNFNGFKVYVFSDDFAYCKAEFVGNQFEFMEDLTGIEQLITMRTFDYFIVSNSTFSYWGPMLSPHPKKVYFPYFMFPNLGWSEMYNDQYWPHEVGVYISYKNPINK